MMLRRMRVEGWRCFANPLDLGPLGEGLNVIHGPNGSGKSTALWALARGLFDSHTVTGSDIKSLRPWGRELNPLVSIEFEHEGGVYRLEKQFLSGQFSRLERLEDGSFVRLAEGRAADEKACDLLSGSPPKRGVSDERHWGFAQVLWATQGQLRIGELSDGTRNTISDALGTQLAGPGADRVEQRVAEEYAKLYTPGGKIRTGAAAPPVVGLEEELVEALARRADLMARLEAFENASRQIEDLNHQVEQAARRESALDEEITRLRGQADEYAKLVHRRELAAEQEKNARARHDQLQRRIAEIRQAGRQLEELTRQQQRIADDLPAHHELLKSCQQQALAAKAALAQLDERRRAVEEARRKAERAERLIRAEQAAAKATELLNRIDQTDARLHELRQARQSVLAPDARTLRKIKDAAREREKLQIQLDAALITLSIEAEADQRIDVVHAEQTGERHVGAGETAEIKGAPQIVLRLPGVGLIRASGPTKSAEQLRSQIADVDRKLEELSAGLGASDVDELERRHGEAARLDEQISKKQTERDTRLEGHSKDDVQQQRQRHQSEANELLALYPQWRTDQPDVAALASDADEQAQRLKRDEREAQAEIEQADRAYNAAFAQHAQAKADLTAATRAQADAGARLQFLQEDGLDDATRRTQVEEAALEHNAANAELKKVDEQLAQFADDPRGALDTLTGQRDAGEQHAAEAREKLIRVEEQLHGIVDEAPYSRLAAVEERIERLEREVDRHRRHMAAIRLLHETLTRVKRRAVEAVLQPVQQRATQTLQRLVGPRFRAIEFDETFLPKGVRPKLHEEEVVLDYLSGGEQEQIHFAVRLALADVAFGEQRQLVVLDDAFTATDTSRLARIINILVEAAQRFQIVLLSCHPERYRHLQNVEFFDLVELARRPPQGAMPTQSTKSERDVQRV